MSQNFIIFVPKISLILNFNGMNKKYNDLQIIDLHKKGLSDKEIAKIIGCTSNQMAKKRKRLGLLPNNKKLSYKLTNEELAIVIGTLLGDSCIKYVHKNCTAPNLQFSHCKQQKEYFLYKKDKLINLMSSFGCYYKKDFFNSNQYKEVYQYTGRNLNCLISIRNIFYPKGIKIIPIDYLKKHLTEESLYYWFMDDGCLDIKHNSYKIATECFDLKNLKDFINLLKDKFNLEFTIRSDGELYLRHKCNQYFTDILNKYNHCKTMNYKILSSRHKTPLNGETPEMDNPVLNLQETEENA